MVALAQPGFTREKEGKMIKKPKISYNTIKRNKTLDGFVKKPEGRPLEEEEEVQA